jgi:Tfp pilus assembly protein PilN
MNEALYGQINFLPDWYLKQRRARVGRQRQILLAGVVLFGVVLLYNGMRQQHGDLEHYRQALQQQIVATQGQLSEVAKLQTARAELNEQLRIYEKLARPVNLTQVINTIGHNTPEGVALTELRSEFDKRANRRIVTPGDPTTGRKPVVAIDQVPFYKIVLEGNAPSNVEIANYVGSLAQTGLFRNVKMIYAREGRIDNAITREFRIAMEVSLDRDYQTVPLEELAHVD